MKYVVLALALALFGANTALAAEPKKVCIKKKDPTTGAEIDACKELTVHKKLEGVKVPDKKAK